MRPKDFIAWLNIKQYKLMPKQILIGIITFLIFALLDDLVFIGFSILFSLPLLIVNLIFPQFEEVPIMNETGIEIFSSIILILSSIVFAFYIGYRYGKFKRKVSKDQVVYKNFALGFFMIGFLTTFPEIISEIFSENPKPIIILELIIFRLKIVEASFVYRGCLHRQIKREK